MNFNFFTYFLLCQKLGKNRFSDADRQKPISYSCSTPQIHIIEEKTSRFYVATFTEHLP